MPELTGYVEAMSPDTGEVGLVDHLIASSVLDPEGRS